MSSSDLSDTLLISNSDCSGLLKATAILIVVRRFCLSVPDELGRSQGRDVVCGTGRRRSEHI